jgi:transposase InsO family protein
MIFERSSVEVDISLSSRRVTLALEVVIEHRGVPEATRCGNGPELTSRHFLSWCEERKIHLIHIQQGRPMQNGQIDHDPTLEILSYHWLRKSRQVSAILAPQRAKHRGLVDHGFAPEGLVHRPVNPL